MSCSGWNEYILNDICDIGSSKRIFAKEYKEEGIPFYRSKEVIELASNQEVNTELFISGKKFNEIDEKFGSPQKGDILIASIGANMGIAYYVDLNYKFYFKDGNVTWLKNFSKDINSRYIYYWITTPYIQEVLKNVAIGSAQKAITIDSLRKLKIKIPSLLEQDRVVDILSALDKKIELNNEMNKTLEDMINSIYKNKIENCNAEKIKVNLSELCKFQEGYVNPPQGKLEYFDGNIKWLRAVDINESYIINTSRTLTEEGFKSAKKSAYLFEPNTIVISKSGTIGRLGIVGDYMCGNRATINIKPKKVNMTQFIYCYLKSRQHELPDLAVGSVQKNLYVSVLENLIVDIPDENILENFILNVDPLAKRIFSNVKENITLVNLRDSLLPKLMGGEISIQEIEANL